MMKGTAGVICIIISHPTDEKKCFGRTGRIETEWTGYSLKTKSKIKKAQT